MKHAPLPVAWAKKRGSVWAMQGLHVGPAAIMRGMMVSDWHWALYGLIFALFGVGQVVWTNTRQAKA